MRAQITATTAVLVLLALASAGVIVYSIELQRVMQANTAAVEQELAEFAALQSDGVNPDTGEPFEDASQMIRLFLSRNVPDDDELLVGWWAGAPRVRSPSDDLTDDPSFRDTVTELAGEGGSRRLQIPERGEVLVTVQAVGTSNEEAALVVVTFLDRTRAGLRATMRTYAAVSLAALALITALAARQSGRLLAPLR